MEDLSFVSDGSHGCRLKRLRWQKCDLSYSHGSRKVFVSRDFPDSLNGFGRNIGQKANDDHACERDYGSCARVPDTGPANASADWEFVDRFGALEQENECSRSVIDSMILPKRIKASTIGDFSVAFQQCNGKKGSQKKASAHRDFPDTFKQCNGKNDSQKKEILPKDARQIDFDDLNGASNFDDGLEPTNTDLVTLRNTTETEVDLLNHDLSLSGQELIHDPHKEKVLNLAADLVNSEGRVASIAPLATLHVSEGNEKAKHIIPSAIQEHDYEVISQTNAIDQSKLENDKASEDFYGQLEISKPDKPDMVQAGACLQLNQKTTSVKTHRKVFAVRDFPILFKPHEDKDSEYDFSLVREPITPTISLEQGKINSFQGQHLPTKESEHRKIVQALIAAPRCPWRLKKSRG